MNDLADDKGGASQDESVSGTPSDEEVLESAIAEFEALEDDTPADNVAVQDRSGADDEAGADPKATPAEPGKGDVAEDQTAGGDTPADNQDSENDIWANAPEELKQARDRELRDADLRYRSSATRQSALDRRVAELEAALAKATGGKSQADGATGSEAGDDGQGGDTKQTDLAELREDFPDLAPLFDEMEKLRKDAAQNSQGVSEFQQQRAAQFVDAQEKVLTEQHPDWLEQASDDRFRGWLSSQPTSIQEAFARNEKMIVDGQDAALVIGRFKSDMGIETTKPAGGGNPKPNPQQQKRERQLNDNRDPSRSGGPATKQGFDPDDFDGVIDALSDKY